MVSIDTYNACVDFPIFDAKSRSMKKAFLGAAGGAIGRNQDNVVVVEALKECEREAGTRRGIYPRWIREGRINAGVAYERQRAMDAAARVGTASPSSPCSADASPSIDTTVRSSVRAARAAASTLTKA